MTNVWGFKPDGEFSKVCCRCLEEQCICGDDAFEAWIKEESASQQGGHMESYDDIPCSPDGEEA